MASESREGSVFGIWNSPLELAWSRSFWASSLAELLKLAGSEGTRASQLLVLVDSTFSASGNTLKLLSSERQRSPHTVDME